MARGLAAVLAAALGSAALVACGSPTRSTAAPSTSTSAASEAPARSIDYVAFAPAGFTSALAPLVALREREGHGVLVEKLEDVFAGSTGDHASALRDEIGRVAHDHPTLRYVLLAGDPKGEGTPLPAFEHKLGSWAIGYVGQAYVSDDDYATATKSELAVGRLPARTEAELTAMVTKIVAYASGPSGVWQRRIGVFAGPANLGDLDPVVEGYATDVLNDRVPYAFDLRVMFASPTSPYAFGFDRFRDEMITSLGSGSLMSVYAGHASETELAGVRWKGRHYPIGASADFARIDAGTSNPILVILTCESGAFGMPSGRSIAESAILADHGPVAVYAASAVSSGMVNFGWAESLIDAFLVNRSKTVGDGIAEAREALPSGSSAIGMLARMALDDLDAQDGPDARKEHLAIFNLFGDPATIPRYPVDTPIHAITRDGHVDVTVDAVDGDANLDVTLEIVRKEVKPGGTPAAELETMPLDAAFAAMSRGNALANDKVVSRVAARGSARPLTAKLDAPTARGTYWIKVSGTVGGRAITGATSIRVD